MDYSEGFVGVWFGLSEVYGVFEDFGVEAGVTPRVAVYAPLINTCLTGAWPRTIFFKPS